MKTWSCSEKKLRKLALLTLLTLVVCGCAASSQQCWDGFDSINEVCNES